MHHKIVKRFVTILVILLFITIIVFGLLMAG